MPLNLGPAAYKDFYNKVQSKFPYKEIRSTRSKFHPKWLLLKSSTPSGIRFHRGNMYPILASTLEPDTAQHLMITGQAIPLPPDFSNILDSMYHWGRAINPHWYYKTLELFHYYLKMEDLDRNMLTTRQLSFDIIQMRVNQKLGDHFGTNSEARNEGFNAFVVYFNNHVCSECDSDDFFGMAVSSFQYLSDLIIEIMNGDYGPVSDDEEDDSEPASYTSAMALPDVVASKVGTAQERE